MIGVLRVVEVIRDRELVRVVQFEIKLREERLVVDLVIDRQPFFLASSGAEEVDQREPLTIFTAINQTLVRADSRRADWARRANWFAEISARQIFIDAFEGEEVITKSPSKPAARVADRAESER